MKRSMLEDYDFQGTITREDGPQMERIVMDFRNDILNEWLNGSLEGFKTLLCQSEQQYVRASRSFGRMTMREMCAFYLGVLSCIIQIFQVMFREESKDCRAISDIARQSPKTEEILFTLYRLHENGIDGIRHGKLAEELGMTDSALSNAMKRALGSGAVEVSRYGKSTVYSLTSVGRRYCAKSQTSRPLMTKQMILRILQNMLKDVPEDKDFSASVIRPNETFMQRIDGGKYQRIHIQSMISDLAANEKYVTCNTVPDTKNDDIPSISYPTNQDSVNTIPA